MIRFGVWTEGWVQTARVVIRLWHCKRSEVDVLRESVLRLDVASARCGALQDHAAEEAIRETRPPGARRAPAASVKCS